MKKSFFNKVNSWFDNKIIHLFHEIQGQNEKQVHFWQWRLGLRELQQLKDPIYFLYGLSENVLNFDLGLLGQGQIEIQIFVKICTSQNIIFLSIEGMYRK